MKAKKTITFSVILLCLTLSATVLAQDARGYFSAESRWFTELKEPQNSLAGEIDLYWELNSSSLTTKVFGRIDDTDNERTHIDIRELLWLYYADAWELRVGINKVFWGVTESAHRVDIINQTDAVESLDGEEKLGQPMVQFTAIKDWGVIDAFVLPYFRERTFDGPKGYINFGAPIAIDNPEYESTQQAQHIDWALRYSHTLGNWDIGLSHFSGTGREPLFKPSVKSAIGPALSPSFNAVPEDASGQNVSLHSSIELVPFYYLIEQTGIDLQATLGAWLWKLEAIHQKNTLDSTEYPIGDFSAVTAGFEYTIFGLFDSAKDLGLLTEIHHNSLGTETIDPLQNDVFIGARLAFNNVNDTSLLLGISQDLDFNDSYLAFIEGSQRIAEQWVITLDGRLFNSNEPADFAYPLRDKDHLTFDIAYFF